MHPAWFCFPLSKRLSECVLVSARFCSQDKKEEDEEDPLNEEDAAALARIGQIKVKQVSVRCGSLFLHNTTYWQQQCGRTASSINHIFNSHTRNHE